VSPGQPPSLPEFLADHCLGIGVADGIRERGYIVHTLRSVYGEDRARIIHDEDWIPDAARAGRIILTKDKRLHREPLIVAAMQGSEARLFCLTDGNLRGAEMRRRFLVNLNRIIQRGARRGPYIYAVHAASLELRWPKST